MNMKKLLLTITLVVIVAGVMVYFFALQPTPSVNAPDSNESGAIAPDAFEATETFAGTNLEGETVIFSHKDFTRYQLQIGDVVSEGVLNTERGWHNDNDATVFVLNWQALEADQMLFVRKTGTTAVTQLNADRTEIAAPVVLQLMTQQPSPENGETTENEYDVTNSDLIDVALPLVGSTVLSPIAVSGQARGQWFFEATAPVTVTNWNGLIMGEGYITAQGNWMTEEFVPFTGSISYTQPVDTYSATGTLIFHNDNPSGLPEYAAAYEMIVQLQPTP